MREIVVEVQQTTLKGITPHEVLDVRLANSPGRVYLARYSEGTGALVANEPKLYEQGQAMGTFLDAGISSLFKDGLLDALGAGRKPAS